MSPAGDFTVALRATWHDGRTDAAAAARHCSTDPGTQGPASYAARADLFGISYQVEGVFVVDGRGMWQLESIAPVTKSRFVAAAFADWIKTAGR